MKSSRQHPAVIMLLILAAFSLTAIANAASGKSFSRETASESQMRIMKAPRYGIAESEPQCIRKKASTRRQEPETTKTVTVHLTYDENLYKFLDAMIKYPNGIPEWFNEGDGGGSLKKGGSEGGDKTVVINLPEGKYDILFSFTNKKTQCEHYVVKEGIDFSETSEMAVDVAEASNKVTFATYLPNGERLKRWVAQYVDEEGNVEFITEGNISKDWDSRHNFICIGEGDFKCYVSANDMINHYDYAANEFFDGSDSDKRIATIFINDVSSKVSIYYLEKYIADGQLNVVQMAWHGGEPMAVDNKENPYASFSFEMQPTPYYYNKPAVGEKMFYPYTSKTIYLGLGSGTGLESRFEESMHYNVSKASSYKDLRFYLVFDLAEYAVPVEDEDPYVYSLCSSDIHIKDDNSFVNSMTNYSYSSVRPENERDIFDNPFSFNMDRCDMKFGESAPFWRVRARRFDYGYSALDLTSTGYIGEERSADILDTHIESVSLDNTDITSDFFFNMRGSIEAYTEKSLPGQKWDIKLDNRNVETEGIKGHAKLELSFTTKEKETLPVLQQVQFRNDEDRITNKFGEAADGRLMLGVGVFSMDYMDEPQEAWQSVWYDCADDAPELEVCYAPYGTDEWTRIDMTENEEKYYPVGVGHVMEASLDGVTERSANGWFDLRVRLISPDGDSQTQTISPAFKVESLTGVSSIKEDSAITVEGNNITAPEDAEVYTIDGTRCDGKGLASGIYIVRTADTVRKVVIK